jgi:hypothetical protein
MTTLYTFTSSNTEEEVLFSRSLEFTLVNVDSLVKNKFETDRNMLNAILIYFMVYLAKLSLTRIIQRGTV